MKYLSLSIGNQQLVVPGSVQHIVDLGNKGSYGSSLLLFGINALMTAAIVLALVFLVWGGINWIISGGEKTKLQTAKNSITYAIAGLVVSLLAFAIVNFVTYFILGGQNFFGTTP